MFSSLPQQICRLIDFSKPFMLHNLGETHADTTRSYFSSWETLIFNTSNPNTSLQPRSDLQPAWFWQNLNLRVCFCPQTSDTALLPTHHTPQHALLRLVFCDLQRTSGKLSVFTDVDTSGPQSVSFGSSTNISCSRFAIFSFFAAFSTFSENHSCK